MIGEAKSLAQAAVEAFVMGTTFNLALTLVTGTLPLWGFLGGVVTGLWLYLRKPG